MKNQLNKENLVKIINYDCVPENEVLTFDIDNTEVVIRKIKKLAHFKIKKR
jgi:hypothetical protein